MTPRIVRLSVATFLLAAAQSTPAQIPSPTATPPPPTAASAAALVPKGDDPLVSIKLSDDTIDQVLELLANYTSRSILRPGNGLPTAPYTVNLKNIPKSEAILALETLLSLNQIGVTPLGDRFLKVVALAQTKTEAPEMITGSAMDLPPSGRIATKIFQLEFLRAAEFMPQLNSMFTSGIGGNGVVVLDKANAAMVTETVSNLQRIETLLKALDKPVTTGMTPKFYVLHNGAKASEVVNKLRSVINGPLQQQLGTATTFNADDRTNQIILIADPRLHSFFDDLIAKLDVKADPNTRNEVIYLKHAKAAEVKALLALLVQGQNAAAQRNAAQSVRPGQITGPTQPVVNPGAPGAPTAPVAQPAVLTGVEGAGPSNEFSTIVNIVNDDRSNAIIVSGTADDVRLIKELVAKVDIILAQVNIEVIIAEVTLKNGQSTGLQALNLTVGTDTPGGTGGDNGRGTHITNFAGTVAGWAVTEGVVNPLAFKAALGNVGSRSNVKLLSVPTITTTHGKVGTVTVGEKRPIISNTVTGNTGTGGSSSSYTLQDIALVLKVTPLIGDDGSIQLEIDQKIDDVIGSVTVDSNPVPIIGTRQAVSYLNVFDGEIRVLGGLQRTKNSRERQKLGFLYEIPLLSQLLGGRTNSFDRTELLIFIRPHVMRLTEGQTQAYQSIEQLSNKEQIKQYLKDPTVQAKDSLIDIIK
ncbi:MAG TPA: secretin N-terminal domain-containing protein [Opitutaceae bacterium]|nr:secretin N-terminal domain-containing protein [Opitutaceae bacterium]